METQVRTPQDIFNQPQRLVVPLFQRPYVWGQLAQWEPLWADVVRVADRKLASGSTSIHPHFLGAVVLQQVPRGTGAMQERIIIDGQQRLTTLQLLFDALHAELSAVGAENPAKRIVRLIENEDAFCMQPEDRFKVWPTNRDREGFNAVMGAPPPVDYSEVSFGEHRIVAAHRFFAEQAREWLHAESVDAVGDRAAAMVEAVRGLLQIVVIDLGVDENAQEIFETLNARGAQLTAADLVKNFVFQRLMEVGADVERIYGEYWAEFETGFWETEVSVGRLRYPRSSLFINHWLVCRTGKEVVAREIFDRFKRYSIDNESLDMPAMVPVIHRASAVYRRFITGAAESGSEISRLNLFGYRTGTLESEVVKPLILFLLDPDQEAPPIEQLELAISSIESWMVRRMLVRATTKNYNQFFPEMITHLRERSRTQVGNDVVSFLAGQKSDSRYWPDDSEVLESLKGLRAYTRLRRGRLRMILEAVEDHLRGWGEGREALSSERVSRGKLAIEHIMPRKWQVHWPIEDDQEDHEVRGQLIHTLGNLTLLTTRLNSKVSNGPWSGPGGKREALEKHDVFLLNRTLLDQAVDDWDESSIQRRGEKLSRIILEIWPVPSGHKSEFSGQRAQSRRRIRLIDLLGAGVLHPGQTLFPRRQKQAHTVAVLLADGTLEIDGQTFVTPSRAAKHLTGRSTNGWWFFFTDQANKVSLGVSRREYRDALDVDAEVDESEDSDEEDQD